MSHIKTFENERAVLLAQSNGCSVWQFRSDTGDGTMTVYDVFPGVMLSFNDFHMEQYNSSYVPDQNILAIDHCREGRMEYAEIGSRVGYDNAAKFTVAFKKIMKFTPSEYRRERGIRYET